MLVGAVIAIVLGGGLIGAPAEAATGTVKSKNGNLVMEYVTKKTSCGTTVKVRGHHRFFADGKFRIRVKVVDARDVVKRDTDRSTGLRRVVQPKITCLKRSDTALVFIDMTNANGNGRAGRTF